MTSDEMTPILDDVERKMKKIEDKNPGLEIAVTGIVPVSSAASHEMIKQLNISLITAIGLILVLIGVGMRSLRAGPGERPAQPVPDCDGRRLFTPRRRRP